MSLYIVDIHGELEGDYEIIKKYEEPTTKNDDLALIHTWGLDEDVRCAMCTNSMKSDRGCDGSCVVNKDMYEAVMDVIEKRIQSTTKKDLAVDAVSRQAVNEYIDFILSHGMGKKKSFDFIKKFVANLPPATPQEPKPMVEIDLYSVIKQKYIEREVLDKLRAEIETKYGQCDICEYFEDYDYEENDISEYRPIGDIADILEIIDKYKAESEG